MKNLILLLVVTAAFRTGAAEADAPRSECIDMDPNVLASEEICLPHMDGYDLLVSRTDSWGGVLGRPVRDGLDSGSWVLFKGFHAYYSPKKSEGRVLYLEVWRHVVLPRDTRSMMAGVPAPRTEMYAELLTEARNPEAYGSNGIFVANDLYLWYPSPPYPYNMLVRDTDGELVFEDCPQEPDFHWSGRDEGPRHLRDDRYRIVEAEGGGESADVNIDRLVRRYLTLERLDTPARCSLCLSAMWGEPCD